MHRFLPRSNLIILNNLSFFFSFSLGLWWVANNLQRTIYIPFTPWCAFYCDLYLYSSCKWAYLYCSWGQSSFKKVLQRAFYIKQNMLCSKITSFPPSEGEFSEKLGIFSKVNIFQNPSCYILEKINENYDKK